MQRSRWLRPSLRSGRRNSLHPVDLLTGANLANPFGHPIIPESRLAKGLQLAIHGPPNFLPAIAKAATTTQTEHFRFGHSPLEHEPAMTARRPPLGIPRETKKLAVRVKLRQRSVQGLTLRRPIKARKPALVDFLPVGVARSFLLKTRWSSPQKTEHGGYKLALGQQRVVKLSIPREVKCY